MLYPLFSYLIVVVVVVVVVVVFQKLLGGIISLYLVPKKIENSLGFGKIVINIFE